MSVPIVNFGFSEEYKEEVFGIREEEGVEISSAGLAAQLQDLAGLGLEEWLEAHGDLLSAVDEAWGNITSIVGLYELGEFLDTHNVAEQLLKSWGSHTVWIGTGSLKGSLQKGALKQNLLMIMIFLNQFLPYLERKVEQMEREAERRLQINLEKERPGGGGATSLGGGGDGEDDSALDEAMDEFFEELDPDEIEPDDVGDLADAFGELGAELDQFENELQQAEAEFGDADEDFADFSRDLSELKKKLLQQRGGLDKLVDRVDGYFGGIRRDHTEFALDR